MGEVLHLGFAELRSSGFRVRASGKRSFLRTSKSCSIALQSDEHVDVWVVDDQR
jgi:hypothetical protein